MFAPAISILKYLLFPFTLLYSCVIAIRNFFYNRGILDSVSFSIPVISVGNLSVGGTGKTPHVEYLIRLLQYQYKVATMSRGYKRATRGFILANEKSTFRTIGDEPMQFYSKFPDAYVSVAEDRMIGIPSLLQAATDTDIIILDDAFQHRSVKPGLNILIMDVQRPFYKDFVLPYGRLRENRGAYKRADVIIVSKCNPAITSEQAQEIIAEIKPIAHQHVYFTALHYQMPYHISSGATLSLTDKNVLLVCCIANPASLIQQISKTANDLHTLSYADHHAFTDYDIEEIKTSFSNWSVSNKVVLTTEKDATRLLPYLEELTNAGISVYVQAIQVQFLLNGQENFDQQVHTFVTKQLTHYHEN